VGGRSSVQNVGCPITSISWRVDEKQGAGTTTIKAGYAL
jgi:hypothetical protein